MCTFEENSLCFEVAWKQSQSCLCAICSRPVVACDTNSEVVRMAGSSSQCSSTVQPYTLYQSGTPMQTSNYAAQERLHKGLHMCSISS